MNNKIEIFEKINPYKAVLYLAIPTIISQLIDVFYNIVDAFFIGRTGNPYMLAAVSISIGLFAISIPMANLLGIGGGSLIARMMGAGKTEDIKKVSSFSIYLSIIIAIIYSIFVVFLLEPLVRLLGASNETLIYCIQYCKLVVIFGAPIMVLANVLSHLLRNSGFSKQAGLGLTIGGLLNIILDPIFMFVLYPAGDEIIAAANATLISNCVALTYMIIIYVITCKKTNLSFNPKYALQISKNDIKEIFKVGIPSALLIFLFIITQMVTNSLMASYGDFEVAAIGIILKIEKIAGAIGIGLSQGMLPIVAYNYTNGNEKRMNDTIKATRKIGILTSSIFVIITFTLAKPITSIFLAGNGDNITETLNCAVLFLRIRCLAPLFMFFNYHSSYSMQAIGDGKRSLAHAVVRMLVLNIPLLFILSHFFGANGIAITFLIADGISAMLSFLFIKESLKKHPIKNPITK